MDGVTPGAGGDPEDSKVLQPSLSRNAQATERPDHNAICQEWYPLLRIVFYLELVLSDFSF
jgi:hypothetical protein